MRFVRFRCVLIALVLFGAMMPPSAKAEKVQTSFTVDANTNALWKFKEGTGTTSANEVAGMPPFVFSGTSWAVGREYYAAALGTGWMAAAERAELRPRTAITIEFWAKFGVVSGDVVCKNGNYLMRLDETISMYFYTTGETCSISGVTPVPLNEWVHIAATYDSTTGKGVLYINGVVDATATITSGLLLRTSSYDNLRLGNNTWQKPDVTSGVDCKIDSFRISKIARVFEPITKKPAPRPATQPGNLVPNGDFEMGLTGWRGDGEGDIRLTWETTTSAPATGLRCLHSLPGASQRLNMYSRPIPAIPGQTYTFSIRMKCSAAPQWPRIQINAVTAEGLTAISPFPIYDRVNNTWTQITRTFTLPATSTAKALCLYFQYSSSYELWVDDVRLNLVDGPTVPMLRDLISVGLANEPPVGNLYAYTPGAKTPVTLRITNADSKAHNVTVQATATDWEGNTSTPTTVGTYSVPAGSAVTTSDFQLDTGRRGNFRLGFNILTEGQKWRQPAEMKYVVIKFLKGVGNAETSVLGMNTHMEREPADHLARSMEVLSQCGIKWIRAWWGWGMCEDPEGTYTWTEYDKQFNAVDNAQMLIMPILLRYYSSWEKSWAGPVTSGAIQEFPYMAKLPAWSTWAGKVAERYKDKIKAYEIWNEPTMGSEEIPPDKYYALLQASSPSIRAKDPNAKIIAFAGVPLDYMEDVLALGAAPLMDAVSEHAYSQLYQPELLYTKRIVTDPLNLNGVMAAGGAGGKAIWHSEQGHSGDDDGYAPMSLPEATIASLVTRNIVTAISLGSKKFMYFSAQTSPRYGMAAYYENYIPRPRTTVMNALAEFIDGAAFQKTVKPAGGVFAHLFKGTNGVCFVWNIKSSLKLTLPISASKLQAFDTMGNPIPVSGTTAATVSIPAERPAFLQCALADYNLLDAAVTGMTVTDTGLLVTVARTTGGVTVTITGQTDNPQDGIVDLIPQAASNPPGWPAAERFHSLGKGQSKTFRFTVPNRAAVKEVRVRLGDREIREIRVPYTGR